MHVVTGGAYHGKSSWVKRFYELDENTSWISAYRQDPCPNKLHGKSQLIVLEGVEEWIRQAIVTGKTFNRQVGKEVINQWDMWTKERDDRQLVIIGTDISKGIVPIDANDRLWRDVTGWFFQDLVARCKRFDIVWYGISRRMK